jgi:Fe-S cluster biogenesis protein NfuA/nitrite reductase/ring-hydroxylating ferredoxin subunit
MAHGGNVRQVGEQIERLLEEVRSMVSPPAWERVDRLVRSIVELYGAGLERIVALLSETGPSGEELRNRLVGDPLVASLLLLHGLHPETLAMRVQQALERVRPYLGSHGGDVEMIGTDEESGVVRLRMKGSCDGCPSSTITVKLAVEGAIHELAPEVTRIEVEGLSDSPPAPEGRASRGRPLNGRAESGAGTPPKWVALADLADLASGELAAAEVSGAHIVLCKVAEQLYAYRNGCPSCGSAMERGCLDGERLACPSCGQRYDVRLAGRSVDRRDLHLDPLPLLEDGGHVKIALPAS